MTQTYAPQGLGGGWRAWWALMAQIVICLALVSALPGFVVWQTWSEARALQAEWTFEGPPCEVVAAPASWATNHRHAPRRFSYGGHEITRQFAAVSCAAVPVRWWLPHKAYHVCMFNNPGAVTVSTVDGPVTFQPPYGQRATIRMQDGRVSCAIGGRFNT